MIGQEEEEEEEINSLSSNLRKRTFSLSNHLGAIIKQLMKNLQKQYHQVGDKLKGNKVRHKVLGVFKRRILVIIKQHQLGELL